MVKLIINNKISAVCNTLLCGMTILFMPFVSLASEVIPIQIGDWYLEPTVDLTYGRTESQFFADREHIEDSYVEINPKVVLSNKTKEREVFLSYELDAVRFKDSSDGDFESSFLEGEYRQSISNHSVASIRGEYSEFSQTNGVRSELKVINPIGENQRIDIEAKELVLKYEFYGTKRQKTGHLVEVSVTTGERDFTVDESEQISVDDRDLSFLAFDGKWRYRWATGSSLFANLNITDFDYENIDPDFNVELDNHQTELIIGLEWQKQRNLYAEIGLGVVRKEFDDLSISAEKPVFYGELEYSPSALDTFRLEAQRRPIEQAGTGLFQDFRELELSWLRGLSRRWSFEAYVGTAEANYEQSTREDDILSYGLIFEYRLSRVADLIFGYRFVDDDSNEDSFDYDAENVFFTFSTGL